MKTPPPRIAISHSPMQPEFFTPTVVARQPDGSLVARAGKPVAVPNGDFITTAEAARRLGFSQGYVEQLCNEGVFIEGEDWWRMGERGWFRIRRAAVLARRGLTS